MNSKNTTVAAIAAAFGAIATAVTFIFDGDPATNPDWGTTIGLLAAAFGLLKARDNNMTSEDAGAK